MNFLDRLLRGGVLFVLLSGITSTVSAETVNWRLLSDQVKRVSCGGTCPNAQQNCYCDYKVEIKTEADVICTSGEVKKTEVDKDLGFRISGLGADSKHNPPVPNLSASFTEEFSKATYHTWSNTNTYTVNSKQDFLDTDAINQVNCDPVSSSVEVSSSSEPSSSSEVVNLPNRRMLSKTTTGILSHPVLLVHGHSTDMSGTFGVEFADEYCHEPEIVSDISSTLEAPVITSFGDPTKLYSRLTQSISTSFKIQCEDGRRLNAQKRVKVVDITTGGDVIDQYSVNSMNFDGTSYNLSSDLGDFIKQFPFGEVYDEWNGRHILNREWEGKQPGTAAKVYPRTRDLVMHYRDESLPKSMAEYFDLNTTYDPLSPKDGINSNGLYFYNAKKVINTSFGGNCANVDPEIYSINVINDGSRVADPSRCTTEQVGPQDGTGGKITYCPAIAEFEVDVRMACPSQTYTHRYKFSKQYASRVSEYQQDNCQIIQLRGEGSRVYLEANCGSSSSGLQDYFTPSYQEFRENMDIDDIQVEWELDGFANADWDPNTPLRYGQPNQLQDRIIEVLDDFYGEGQWQDDPDAVLDIVTHSQGGLITRVLIGENRMNSNSNPINHINEIYNIDTPHIGSGFATSGNRLIAGNPLFKDDDESAYGKNTFPVWGDLRNKVLGSNSELFNVLPHDIEVDILGGLITVTGNVSTKSLLGPYTTNINLDIDGLPIFTLPKYKTDPIKSAREAVHELNTLSEHLAWSVESDYIKKLQEYAYPKYTDNSTAMKMSNLHSTGVPSFTYLMVKSLIEESYANCPQMIAAKVKAIPYSPNRICREIFSVLDQNLQAFKLQFADLDADWSNHSDFVVEISSQKGMYPSYETSRGDITEWAKDNDIILDNLYSHPFSNDLYHSKVGHTTIPGLKSAAAQTGCETLSVIMGYTDVDRFCVGSQLQESLLTKTQINQGSQVIEFKMPPLSLEVGETSLELDYYLAAPEGELPQISQCNNAVCELKPMPNGWYLLNLISNPTELNDQGEYVLSVTLEYSSGNPRLPSFDYSANQALGVWELNDLVGVKFKNQVIHEVSKGITLISTQFDQKVKVQAKERSYNINVSQPSLIVTNTSDESLNYLQINYYVTAPSIPVLKVYWASQMDKLNYQVFEIGENEYVIQLEYNGIDLKPGESLSNVEFELNHSDWSSWYYDDDYSQGSTHGYRENPNIVVKDLRGTIIAGVEPQGIDNQDSTIGQAEVTIYYQEESNWDNLSNPRIKLQNTGTQIIKQLSIYYYYEVEELKLPQLKLWDVPDCTAINEQMSSNIWRVKLTCDELNLEPGEDSPNVYGSIFGLHYSDWSPWDKTNDYSYQESNSYIENDKIVIEDHNGQVIWGAHP